MRKFFITLLIVTISSSLMASTYNDALNLFKEKKYKESLTILGQILDATQDFQKDSPNYKIRFLAAHNHWELGNLKSSMIHFNRCIEIDRNNINTYIDIALLYIKFKQFNNADIYAKKGLFIKKDPMLYYTLGKIFLEQKNYWKAKVFFEKVNSLNPEIFVSYHDLGIVLMKLKKYSEANVAFLTANFLNPDSSEALNNLALSYELLGDKLNANLYYEKAFIIDGKNSIITENYKRTK
jgi:tetratricopeptide (TPR) repeat protein